MVSCRIVIFVIISKIKIGLKSCQVGAHMVVWVDGVKYVHSLGANILSAFAVRDGDDCGAGRRGRVAGRGGVSLCPVDVRLSEAIQTEPNKGMSCRLPITRVLLLGWQACQADCWTSYTIPRRPLPSKRLCNLPTSTERVATETLISHAKLPSICREKNCINVPKPVVHET